MSEATTEKQRVPHDSFGHALELRPGLIRRFADMVKLPVFNWFVDDRCSGESLPEPRLMFVEGFSNWTTDFGWFAPAIVPYCDYIFGFEYQLISPTTINGECSIDAGKVELCDAYFVCLGLVPGEDYEEWCDCNFLITSDQFLELIEQLTDSNAQPDLCWSEFVKFVSNNGSQW